MGKKIEMGFYSNPTPGTGTAIDSNRYRMFAWLEGSSRVESVNFKNNRNEARVNNNKIKFDDLPDNIKDKDKKFFVHIWLEDKNNKEIRSDVKVFEIDIDSYDSTDLNIKKDVLNVWIETIEIVPLAATKIIIGGESPEPPKQNN
ncbi:MAG: hypothetical protein U0T77_03235 [Chitinophagales bacterium]